MYLLPTNTIKKILPKRFCFYLFSLRLIQEKGHKNYYDRPYILVNSEAKLHNFIKKARYKIPTGYLRPIT